VVDLHVLTVYQEPEILRTKIRETVGLLLACGIDLVAGKGYCELQRTVADLVIMTLGPIQERYYALMDDQTALDALLQKGVDTAREGAAVTLRAAKERVGLWALP
jgi:tryptophanyl-tRNA synthetase